MRSFLFYLHDQILMLSFRKKQDPTLEHKCCYIPSVLAALTDSNTFVGIWFFVCLCLEKDVQKKFRFSLSSKYTHPFGFDPPGKQLSRKTLLEQPWRAAAKDQSLFFTGNPRSILKSLIKCLLQQQGKCKFLL